MVMETTPVAEESPPPVIWPDRVIFLCAEYLFAVKLLETREIVPPMPLTRLPGCGPEVAGLIGLRGRVITVFDFGVLLGLPSALKVADHRIIVLDLGERVAGFAVDRIVEVVRGEDAAIEAGEGPPLLIGSDDIEGVGQLKDVPWYSLDIHAMLARLLV